MEKANAALVKVEKPGVVRDDEEMSCLNKMKRYLTLNIYASL